MGIELKGRKNVMEVTYQFVSSLSGQLLVPEEKDQVPLSRLLSLLLSFSRKISGFIINR